MPRSRTAAAGLTALVLLGVAAAAPTASENLARLRSMPLEQRQRLVENLNRFDALSREEQAALRTLDRQLAETSPQERARYESVLHRYHLWLRTLTEEQRHALAATPPSERASQVLALRQAQRNEPTATDLPALVQNVALSPVGLLEQAQWVASWLSLNAEEKAAVEKVASIDERLRALEQQGREHGVNRARLMRPLRGDIEDTLKRQLTTQPALRRRLEMAKPQVKAEMFRYLLDGRILQQFEPERVTPARLERFLSAIPPWLRQSFYPLPSDAAQQRLTVLYRMIYPSPAEIPDPGTTPTKSAPTPPIPTGPGPDLGVGQQPF